MFEIILFLALSGLCFLLSYLASWLIHGKLIKRIKNTLYYIKLGHQPVRAWRYAGVTL